MPQASLSLSRLQEELVALRDQFELVLGFQDQLLATVYWTLGVIGTVVGCYWVSTGFNIDDCTSG